MKKKLTSFLLVFTLFITIFAGKGIHINAATYNTVYFNNTVTKWSQVYAYVWSDSQTAVAIQGTKISGTNTYQFSIPNQYTKILFKNTAGTGNWNLQTADKEIPTNNLNVFNPNSSSNRTGGYWTVYSGSVTPTPKVVTPTPKVVTPTPSSTVSNKKTIYFNNTLTKWSQVYAYVWSDGQAAIAVQGNKISGTNTYQFSIPNQYKKILFKNTAGTGNWNLQTADKEIPTNNLNVFNPNNSSNHTEGYWTVYSGSATPTVTPKVTPTVTPKVTPTVTPKVTPTVTPTSTPNVNNEKTVKAVRYSISESYYYHVTATLKTTSNQSNTVIKITNSKGEILLSERVGAKKGKTITFTTASVFVEKSSYVNVSVTSTDTANVSVTSLNMYYSGSSNYLSNEGFESSGTNWLASNVQFRTNNPCKGSRQASLEGGYAYQIATVDKSGYYVAKAAFSTGSAGTKLKLYNESIGEVLYEKSIGTHRDYIYEWTEPVYFQAGTKVKFELVGNGGWSDVDDCGLYYLSDKIATCYQKNYVTTNDSWTVASNSVNKSNTFTSITESDGTDSVRVYSNKANGKYIIEKAITVEPNKAYTLTANAYVSDSTASCFKMSAHLKTNINSSPKYYNTRIHESKQSTGWGGEVISEPAQLICDSTSSNKFGLETVAKSVAINKASDTGVKLYQHFVTGNTNKVVIQMEVEDCSNPSSVMREFLFANIKVIEHENIIPINRSHVKVLIDNSFFYDTTSSLNYNFIRTFVDTLNEEYSYLSDLLGVDIYKEQPLVVTVDHTDQFTNISGLSGTSIHNLFRVSTNVMTELVNYLKDNPDNWSAKQAISTFAVLHEESHCFDYTTNSYCFRGELMANFKFCAFMSERNVVSVSDKYEKGKTNVCYDYNNLVAKLGVEGNGMQALITEVKKWANCKTTSAKKTYWKNLFSSTSYGDNGFNCDNAISTLMCYIATDKTNGYGWNIYHLGFKDCQNKSVPYSGAKKDQQRFESLMTALQNHVTNGTKIADQFDDYANHFLTDYNNNYKKRLNKTISYSTSGITGQNIYNFIYEYLGFRNQRDNSSTSFNADNMLYK